MSESVHVFHIVDTLETGGLERGVVNVIQGLDPGRFRHTVCAIRNLGPLADLLPRERTAVSCLYQKPGRFSVVAGELARRIRQAKPDVVHARNWGTVEGIWAARLAGTRGVVYSEHGTESSDGRVEPRLKRWLRRLAYESAHGVFSVSFQLRDACAARTGFPAERIGVIHNGVDTARYAPNAAKRAEMRRELGLTGDEVCLGVVGRLEPVKDHATLLRAAAQLQPALRWRIVVAGEGSLEASLRRQIAETPALTGRVQFLGDTPRVAELLQAFDIYILPSISEGISNSLLEAMSCGVPTLATATGGNPEVVVHGDSGRLFPMGGAGELARYLHEWIADPSQREGWGDRARQRVLGHFSLDAMVARYGRLYARLGAASTVQGVFTEEKYSQ